MRVPKESASDLERLSALIEAGQVTPSVGATYPLDDAAQAMRDLVAGRVRGKAAIIVVRLELVLLAQRLGPPVRVVHQRYGASASARVTRPSSGGWRRRSRPGGRGPTRPPACHRSRAAALSA